jgi:hypothetical protein
MGTTIDLLVTVPRYRLEAVMTESNATRVLTLAIPGLLGLGAVSALEGGFPWLSDAMVPVVIGLPVFLGLGCPIAKRQRAEGRTG